MKAFYSDHFVLPLPDGHRFPMEKYSMLRQKVSDSGLFELAVPEPVTDEEILRAHTEDYLRRVASGEMTEKEMRRIGFPWSEFMVERSRRASGGTLEAARAALSDGVAVNLAGGTHHAFAHRGEGFCVFNDTAIAARALQAAGGIERAVVVDTDVHQGNGTASILEGDDSVFTFSIHGAKNFPFHKERSDLDVELADGTEDDEYLEALEDGLEKSLSLMQDADLAFFLAGADPFSGDRLGRMGVSKRGLARRDEMVLDALAGRGIPTVVTMAGGYARDIRETVGIQYQTVERAASYSARSVKRN